MKRVLYFLVISLSLSFFSCTKHFRIVTVEPESIKTDEGVVEDVSIVELIAPYKEELEVKMDAPIGEVAQALEKAKPESALGNWVADLIHKKCQDYYKRSIDFSIVNYGGLRIPVLPEGGLTKGKIFELMPFDNVLVVMELDGLTLLDLFKVMAGQGGWPISREVSYKIEEGNAREIMIKGEPLDLARTYRVGLSDYLANGGDNLPFLASKPRVDLEVLFRDAIIQYVEELGGLPIRARVEGRVVDLQY